MWSPPLSPSLSCHETGGLHCQSQPGIINTMSIIFMVTVYLDCKVLEARIKKSVEVSFDCFLDQVRIETSGHHSHTYEGRQDGTGLEDWLVWEGVDGDQTYEVADCLR